MFFEETSLVGRDERRLEFKTLQRRLEQRLAFLGIKYDPSSRREEESALRGLPPATARCLGLHCRSGDWKWEPRE